MIARYLTPALVASPADAVWRGIRQDRAVLTACYLCGAFRGATGSVRWIAHVAEEALDHLVAARGLTEADGAAVRLDATHLRDRVAELPRVDHVGTLVALVRELLDGATSCLALDRAVRDAGRLNGHAPTPAQEERAGEILCAWREASP